MENRYGHNREKRETAEIRWEKKEYTKLIRKKKERKESRGEWEKIQRQKRKCKNWVP